MKILSFPHFNQFCSIDPITMLNGAQSMGNHNHCLFTLKAANFFNDLKPRFIVEGLVASSMTSTLRP